MTEEQINMNALKYARENSQPVLNPDDNGDIISDFDDLVCAYIEGAHSIKKEYDSLNKDMQWLLKRLRESAIRLHKARNPWNDATEKLPEKLKNKKVSDYVFVMWNDGSRGEAYYNYEEYKSPRWEIKGAGVPKPKYWMYIPKLEKVK